MLFWHFGCYRHESVREDIRVSWFRSKGNNTQSKEMIHTEIKGFWEMICENAKNLKEICLWLKGLERLDTPCMFLYYPFSPS